MGIRPARPEGFLPELTVMVVIVERRGLHPHQMFG
jgi:hypothetical protein